MTRTKGISMLKQMFVASLLATIVVALPASALAAIRITKIAFDPAGTDSGSNASLNSEWILLKNTGSSAKQLDGWKLLDRGPDHRYRFGAISVAGGDLVKLHSGTGSHRVTTGCGGDCLVHHYYWGLDNYVWNNDGDRATLKNAGNDVVDRCAYSSSANSPVRC